MVPSADPLVPGHVPTDGRAQLTPEILPGQRLDTGTLSSSELSRLRAKVYGVRIADDPKHPAAFVAICPQHRVLGSNLTISDARVIMNRHVDEAHHTIDPDEPLETEKRPDL